MKIASSRKETTQPYLYHMFKPPLPHQIFSKSRKHFLLYHTKNSSKFTKPSSLNQLARKRKKYNILLKTLPENKL